SLYLDVTKDRLYTMPEDSRGRRSAQSAMYHVSEAFVRWLAPVLSFTADELWGHLPAPADGPRAANVLFATWYDGLTSMPASIQPGAGQFERLLALREQVAKVLEPMRAAGTIGAALEADITLHASAGDLAWLEPLADELRFLLISGDVRVEAGTDQAVTVSAVKTSNCKCVRCWQYRADIGQDATHPALCARCVLNLGGPGEERRYF
ncbi:MAG TPA: class I tRNA ligase family protein, partial [Luteimonas sp.]|nr:class I tRNA ligase family protein [Luteimonas sp.]